MMLAHQGGWDEFWLPVGILALIVGAVIRAVRGRKGGGSVPGKEGHCLYCGSRLADGAGRCERCGFKKESRK